MSIEQTNKLYIEHSKKVGYEYSESYRLGITHNKSKVVMSRTEYLDYIVSSSNPSQAERGYKDGRQRKRPPAPWGYKDVSEKNIKPRRRDGKVSMSHMIGVECKEKCKDSARSEGLTLTDWVERALNEALKEVNKD